MTTEQIERAIKHLQQGDWFNEIGSSVQDKIGDDIGTVCEFVRKTLTEQAARLEPKPLVPTESRESGVWGKCPNCGKVNRHEYHFCANCGIPSCSPKEDEA